MVGLIKSAVKQRRSLLRLIIVLIYCHFTEIKPVSNPIKINPVQHYLRCNEMQLILWSGM